MATNTYVALDKVTVGTATNTVTFTSIPATYTDLRVVASVKGNVGSPTDYTVNLQFNGDTTTNYSRTLMRGTGSAAESARSSTASQITLNSSGYLSTTVFQNVLLDVFNYSNSTTFKTILCRADQPDVVTMATVGVWRKTPEAITSLTIFLDSGNFGVGSTFSLYGIASEGAAYATGGYVTSDANYYYHTFTASGTFTPKQTLSCDYLVVAGGGGGGSDQGGGGAGGGYRTGTATLTALTNYSCTVGGGGAGGSASGVGTQGASSVFNSVTSAGGGYGSGYGANVAGGNGGSGGGAAALRLLSGGTGNTPSTSPSQGNNGGSTTNGSHRGAGGGGAGATGSSGGVTSTGAGGAGTSSSIGGTSVERAGGGSGGGIAGDTIGTTSGGGGAGGGGAAGLGTPGTVGTVNTGGGGGGGGYNAAAGGAGGSGIVIVRYAK